jgi:hypothetical protein
MRPATARSISMTIVAASTGMIWRVLDPEGWKPVGALLAYWWVIVPAWIAYALFDIMLMEWFGRRGEDGQTEQYVDPLEVRLEAIEAAINRLHDYVQEIDPELEEERRLEAKFMSGNGGMFAGMNHFEYVRDREEAGKRTIRGHSIWHDPESQVEPAEEG